MKIRDGNPRVNGILIAIFIFACLSCIFQLSLFCSLFDIRFSLETSAANIGFSIDTGNRPLKWEGIRFSEVPLFDGFSSMPEFWIVKDFRGHEFNSIVPIWLLIILYFTIRVAINQYAKLKRLRQ